MQKCESVSRRFQPGEGPSKGLLCDCEIFADGSFAALINMVAVSLSRITAACRIQIVAAIQMVVQCPWTPARDK